MGGWRAGFFSLTNIKAFIPTFQKHARNLAEFVVEKIASSNGEFDSESRGRLPSRSLPALLT
jgi:hypothetical protein